MWNIISSSEGNYNHCGDTNNITWLLLSGHIRSMHSHIPNVLSFLGTSSDCWFVVVFTRNELTGDSIGFQRKHMCDESNNCTAMKREYNVTKHLNEMQQHSFRSNFAYCVAERNEEPGGGEWTGNLFSPEWPGVTMAMRLVAKSHDIRHSSADIVILTRPDIILSHAIQTKNLHELASKENATFLVPHYASKFGTGNDPSEVWVLMTCTWDLLVGMCSLEVSLAPCLKNKNASQCLSPIYLADFTTSESQCGHYYKRVLSAGTSYMNASTYYIRTELKFHFHRITGMYSKAVNAPGSKQINSGKSLANSPRLDLLKNVDCEYSPPNVCDKKKDSTILVDGNHKAKYTTLRYDGTAYVCTKQFDLQT